MHSEVDTFPVYSELLDHLQAELKSFAEVYLVVDGLDVLKEDTKQILLLTFQAIHSNSRTILFLDSLQEMKNTIEGYPVHELRLSESDLALLVDQHDHFQKFVTNSLLSQNESRYDVIKRRIIQKANGK